MQRLCSRGKMHGACSSLVRRGYSTAPSSFYDAVVVGGGMVGNAMACSIGLSPTLSSKKVLVLESGSPSPLKRTADYSNRVSAIGPASIKMFQRMGVWKKLVEHRVKRVDRLQVLDSCSRSTISLQQPDHSEVAYIIENNAMVAVLSECIAQRCPNVQVRTNATVVSCQVPDSLDQLARIELSDGSRLSTSLVIGADGARSAVRHALGVQYTGWEYGQQGIVATLRVHAQEHNSTAWQRFTDTGPIALLPLSDELSSLTWTTEQQHAKHLLSLSPEQFVDQLNRSLTTAHNQSALTNDAMTVLDKLLGSAPSASPYPPRVIALQGDTRAAFPLGFGHTHQYVTTRCALVGDAAHRIHPLAGQGVNLGYADVRALTDALETSVSRGADWGSASALCDYESAAQRHNMPVQVVCDWINRLYRTSVTPVVLARSLGMLAVHRLTPLKHWIVHLASH